MSLIVGIGNLFKYFVSKSIYKNFSIVYGTLLTPEKYYLEWREEGFCKFSDERDETNSIIGEKCKDIDGKLFKELFCLFYKKRFFDFIAILYRYVSN